MLQQIKYIHKYPEKENKEDAEIGGSDFYSATKSSAELLINAFINSSKNNSLNVSVVRSGNVIGGGDRSENRLMTDLVMALNNDQNFNLKDARIDKAMAIYLLGFITRISINRPRKL